MDLRLANNLYRKMHQVRQTCHSVFYPSLKERICIANSLPEFNAAAMANLEAMGFPTIRCQKALLATGNSDPEAAMEWLFAHMEDPGTFFLGSWVEYMR